MLYQLSYLATQRFRVYSGFRPPLSIRLPPAPDGFTLFPMNPPCPFCNLPPERILAAAEAQPADPVRAVEHPP